MNWFALPKNLEPIVASLTSQFDGTPVIKDVRAGYPLQKIGFALKSDALLFKLTADRVTPIR